MIPLVSLFSKATIKFWCLQGEVIIKIKVIRQELKRSNMQVVRIDIIKVTKKNHSCSKGDFIVRNNFIFQDKLSN